MHRRHPIRSLSVLSAGVIGALVGGVGLAGTAHAAPPVLSVTEAAVLTLPAGDGFRDSSAVTVSSDTAGSVSVVVDSDTIDPVVVDESLELVGADSAYSATVDIPIGTLAAGTYSVVVEDAVGGASTSTDLVVGSGVVQTIELALPDGTKYYPFKDGKYDAITAIVAGIDETGTVVPATGALYAKSGTKTVSKALSVLGDTPLSTALTITSLPLGASGSVWAALTGPVGDAYTGAPIPVMFNKSKLQGVTLWRELSTVYPYDDDYRDTVKIAVNPYHALPYAPKVSGKVTIKYGSKTIKSWDVTTTAKKTYTWNGKQGTRIVPGKYTVTVSVKGSQGDTFKKSTTITVSSKKLAWKTTSTTARATSLIEQYEAYDEWGQGFCYTPDDKAVGCYSYDDYYTEMGVALYAWGYTTIPSTVKSSAKYGDAPYVRITANTTSEAGTTIWSYGVTDDYWKEGTIVKGPDNNGWLKLKNSPSQVWVDFVMGQNDRFLISSFKIEYKYRILR